MQKLSRNTVKSKTYTQRVIQFGEGNFLRAFVNWMVHKMNQKAEFDAGVVVIQPIEHGLIDVLNKQDGLYTINLNGIKNGTAVNEYDIIDCIQKGIMRHDTVKLEIKRALFNRTFTFIFQLLASALGTLLLLIYS